MITIPHTQLKKAARQICDRNSTIKALVNQQIQQNRTLEVLARKTIYQIDDEQISLIKKRLK